MIKIALSNVLSVYSGKAGKCCCGCSGKHTYASATRDAAGKRRGYPVTDDDEISDRCVKHTVAKIRNAPEVEVCIGHVSVTIGTRVHIAYLRA